MAGWLAPLSLLAGSLLLYCVNLDDGLTVHDELHHILAGRGLLETGEPRIADGLYQRTYLFTWLVAQSLRLLGDNLFAARLPAVIPMALLVAAMFVWLRATAGEAAAWTASVLFAVSPFAVGYAQFVRFYALQSLAFFLAAIALAALLQGPGGALRRALLATGGLAALWLAVELQDTTLLGVVALGAWAVAAVALPWLGDPAVPPGRRIAGLLGGALALLVALLLLWQSGALGELWERYRWTPVFNEGSVDRFWYYHGWLVLYYPSLWPATGVLGLLAVVAAPRAGLMALIVFTVSFLLNSFAGPKSLRYLAYALPFLFILWGIGLAALWPTVRAWLSDLALRLAPAAGIGAGWGRRLGTALVAAAGLFLVLANPAWLRSASLLADVAIPPEEPYLRWRLAEPALRPWLDRAAVVVTTSELETLYHLGRYDLLLSRSRLSEMPEEQQHEFGIDPRTGRPVISRPETVAMVIDCTATGLVISVAHHWTRTFQADEATKALIERQAQPLALPPASRILAWTWQQPAGWQRPAACASLPPLTAAPTGSG
jgi:hypothetical protein